MRKVKGEVKGWERRINRVEGPKEKSQAPCVGGGEGKKKREGASSGRDSVRTTIGTSFTHKVKEASQRFDDGGRWSSGTWISTDETAKSVRANGSSDEVHWPLLMMEERRRKRRGDGLRDEEMLGGREERRGSTFCGRIELISSVELREKIILLLAKADVRPIHVPGSGNYVPSVPLTHSTALYSLLTHQPQVIIYLVVNYLWVTSN
ncbi:hypothetical protein BU24DRAFT_197453 [Aaosphaeria arxii CBS 175.79]|uniref:Uncharacterized protein n=1 Tax=Aaosphaeria arxii CBS 175.79 TaxID=1450172 RepID=A0A6A5XSH9_9PLEO|nr:uncharacterized protein BU24DRAFT_197453 [Aaosphaeria arxii CBS 175.79]KAF2016258.1 hypothetical protein BU24DRAFT_197453 [Aaosphaeria arxii CBS 175.79]